jgi:thiol:disulfide interchange protein DsbD
VSAGDIDWPLPHKIAIGTLANYGYEGTVLLPVPLRISPAFKPSATEALLLRLKASWLVCRQECIPEEAEFSLRLPVRGSTVMQGAAFEAARLAQPRLLPASDSQVQVTDGALLWRVSGLPAQVRGQTLALFAQEPEIIETAAPMTQSWDGAVWTARVPLSAQRNSAPQSLSVLLVREPEGAAKGADTRNGREGFVAQAQVSGTWPVLAARATELSPALSAALQANAQAAQARLSPSVAPVSPSWWLALLGALLGGLILNLMPCVFPVLALKVLGFARHGEDRHAHRLNGLAYSAGVVLSFVALGGLMLMLRSAGEQLGWGFQLQSPAVVAALALLFTVLALNLAGLFEFGTLLPSRVATLEARHPGVNAFLSGVLAVAIASPCTAPFMGASLGLALGLPAAQALLIFACLGLGMALPYLAASWVPAVARWLPRPGAWMNTLRQAMAFPMLATVVWLVWVLGQQSGVDGAAALLALLLGVSLLIWSLTLTGRARRTMVLLAMALLLALLSALGPWVLKPLEEPALSNTPSADSRWQPWSPARLDVLRAQGRPVFVDFTAAWCVTCQYNKKTTLANPALLADMATQNVALLRADWTRRDPAITAALAALGRNGVPVYVVYKPGQAPVVLSEILSVAEVRAALALP